MTQVKIAFIIDVLGVHAVQNSMWLKPHETRNLCVIKMLCVIRKLHW